jgi:hypothetical protein
MIDDKDLYPAIFTLAIFLWVVWMIRPRAPK